MTEAVLIEIARRFRRLEDLVERADLYHVAQQAQMKSVAAANALTEIRDHLDLALERCREDMTAMQEQIRRDMAQMKSVAAVNAPRNVRGR